MHEQQRMGGGGGGVCGVQMWVVVRRLGERRWGTLPDHAAVQRMLLSGRGIALLPI